MTIQPLPIKGRGAADNPANRFERIVYSRDDTWIDDDWAAPDDARPATEFLIDRSRSVISYNDSPDVPFDASLNPYRGCEHGCVYCYARPTHEYLGLSAGLDFETRILVKPDAPLLLRRELSSPKWKPQQLALSGVTDPYQPIERKLQLTRKCLEVLVEFRNPVGVVTKNAAVARDADLLAELARHDAASVHISVTTLDDELARRLEPRTCRPRRRLEAVAKLRGAGVPAGVMVAPVIPGLNDHEIPAIVSAAADAGATSACFVMLRLPHGVAPMFESWLEQHYPMRKNKVLDRLRAVRGGDISESRFHKRMRGTGTYAEQIKALFESSCRRAGIKKRSAGCSTEAFRRPSAGQLTLFDTEPLSEPPT